MKSYQKPSIQNQNVLSNDQIASLNTWLSTNGLTEAGITTYVVHS